MQLSWSTEYRDFADTEHWIPRSQKLEKSFSQISLESVPVMETEQLLNIMEQLSELMMYYISVEDMKKLEPVMRTQERLLAICRSKGLSSIGYLYLEMMFVRVNGHLYQSYHKNRQAVECYRDFMEKAEQCFQTLKTDASLSTVQKTFVGWSCVEGYKAAAVAARMVLDNKMVFDTYRMVLPILVWLENNIMEFPGICDKVADFYALIASDFYMNQQGQEGAEYYERAISILNNIWLKSESDFYYSKMLWYLSLYGIAEFSYFEKKEKMADTERMAEEFLKTKNPQEWEKGIVEGVLGMTALQQGMVFQQKNETSDAIRCLMKSSEYLNRALRLLETEYQNKTGYEVYIIKDMALKVYCSYMSALYTLGTQYYFCGQSSQAADVFTKALTYLTNEKKYRFNTAEAMLQRADSSQYLAMIALEEGDKPKAEYYGTQAADWSLELAQPMGYSFVWGIHISSCMITAEICLSMGKKDKASEYADKGIAACEVLKQIEPTHPKLAMQKKLMKLRKKAMRKFFINKK